MAMHSRVGVARAEAIRSSDHKAWASKLWHRIDRDRDGQVTRDELNCNEFQDALRSIIAPTACSKVIGSYGRAEQNVQQLISYCIRKADTNNNGCLSRREFESFTRELRNQHSAEDKASLIFALFDLDGDQHIDKEEFAGIYRFYLGTHPIANEFRAEWERLDREGNGRVNKDQFVRWMPRAFNPCFRQHAGAVYRTSESGSSSPSAPSSALSGQRPAKPSPKKSTAAEQVFRPAPGLMPRRGDPPELPVWNENFAAKDPSEQNLAVRGNLLMKTYFSRPQSLPELRRFYKTYTGFDSNLEKLETPEPPPPRKPVLSEETWEQLAMPGMERHLEGGTMKNARGEELPWRELTPRALKKVYREPGTMLLRVPVGTPRFQTPWTERHRQPAQATRRLQPSASMEELMLRAPRGRRAEDAPVLGELLTNREAPAVFESEAPTVIVSEACEGGGLVTPPALEGGSLDALEDTAAGEAVVTEVPAEPMPA